MSDKQSKPVVPVRGEAVVYYNKYHKCFYFDGVIGLGHPRLAEGVLIHSSRIVRIQSSPQVIETLNTIYECDTIVFSPEDEEALNLGRNFAKSKTGQVTLK